MVNKDMNGFPVKKCSAFQFFKKRVRRWIKSPMVSVDKHQSPSLKYTGPPAVPIPPAEPDLEPSLCQTCLGEHAFQRAVLPPEKESCSWETQSGCEVKEPCNHANILTKPDPRTFWTNDDSEKRWKRSCSLGEPGRSPSTAQKPITLKQRKSWERKTGSGKRQEEGRRREWRVGLRQKLSLGLISALWLLVPIIKGKGLEQWAIGELTRRACGYPTKVFTM